MTKRRGRVLQTLSDGKLYELYCLSELLLRLSRNYGFRISFQGSNIRFKAAPGLIRRTDPHLLLTHRQSPARFDVFVNIEFTTLGNAIQHIPHMRNVRPVTDLSKYHELDILVVEHGVCGRPPIEQIALGMECKSGANFKKSIVRDVLGVRRELGLLASPRPSTLSVFPQNYQVLVPANPPTEFWLAFVDFAGTRYSQSPERFGIKFQHWAP